MRNYITDGLRNLVANLGTSRDKVSGNQYGLPCLSDDQINNAYRGAWLPRKIIDIPALDSCRNWRDWQAEADQIERIEAEEKRLGVKGKVLQARIAARLWGGAALYIGTGDENPAEPLNPESIQQGGIEYLTLMTRRTLSAGEVETDPISPNYGKPRYYTTGNVDIHPSRLVIFIGAEVPDKDLDTGTTQGWGDPVLLSIMDAVKNADATAGNIASLVFEAKIDVIKIPGFMAGLADSHYEAQVLNRLQLAATAKGINGALMLDAEEDYQQKSANFATLPDVLASFMQLVSGAADIPLTRLLGQSPGGMNATGESDVRNYYDRISAAQELEMQPAMNVLDECLIRSALGNRPDDIWYQWGSLWQITDKERADIGKTIADTIKILADTRLLPEDSLAEAAVNALTEAGCMPGLELSEEMDEEESANDITDAAPRALYVSRKVLNADEIREWAKGQGITVTADDLHVTIAASRASVDWMQAGETWSRNSNGELLIEPGGARLMEQLGESALVILFNSCELSYRHMQIKEVTGASWDFPEYQPHITVDYEWTGSFENVEPYQGRILLGPEVFEEFSE